MKRYDREEELEERYQSLLRAGSRDFRKREYYVEEVEMQSQSLGIRKKCRSEDAKTKP